MVVARNSFPEGGADFDLSGSLFDLALPSNDSYYGALPVLAGMFQDRRIAALDIFGYVLPNGDYDHIDVVDGN